MGKTTAIIKGKETRFDLCDMKKLGGLDENFEYLGHGKINSVDGKEYISKESYHFWKNKI